MTIVGRNMKITISRDERAGVRRFFHETLGCTLKEPMAELDLFLFEDGFSLGAYYVAPGEALTADQWERAPWIELVVEDVQRVTDALASQGVSPFDYPVDPSHHYFQGPGGLVFRLADAG